VRSAKKSVGMEWVMSSGARTLTLEGTYNASRQWHRRNGDWYERQGVSPGEIKEREDYLGRRGATSSLADGARRAMEHRSEFRGRSSESQSSRSAELRQPAAVVESYFDACISVERSSPASRPTTVGRRSWI